MRSICSPGRNYKKIAVCVSLLIILLSGSLFFLLPDQILPPIANLLILDERPEQADAIIVLNTGMEYFARLMEAAHLYKNGYAGTVIINGNRKNNVLRQIEMMGYRVCCPWPEESLRILETLEVPRNAVIAFSAENVYDTESEARFVGEKLASTKIKRVIITTSKAHTRRAHHIWKNLFGDRFDLQSVAAKNDPFSPQGWWKDGRQVRWLLYEYGSWLFYYWKKVNQ